MLSLHLVNFVTQYTYIWIIPAKAVKNKTTKKYYIALTKAIKWIIKQKFERNCCAMFDWNSGEETEKQLCFPDSFAVDQWKGCVETPSYFVVWSWRRYHTKLLSPHSVEPAT